MAAGVDDDAVEQLGRRRHQVSTPVINRQHAADFRVDARPEVGHDRPRRPGPRRRLDRAAARPHDGRSWLVELTPDGQRTARTFKRLVSAQIEHMLSGMAGPDRKTVEAALSTLVLANEFPDTWPDD